MHAGSLSFERPEWDYKYLNIDSFFFSVDIRHSYIHNNSYIQKVNEHNEDPYQYFRIQHSSIAVYALQTVKYDFYYQML